MSAIDFEYAIKKDVRNNPIVREVDDARQRAAVALARRSAGSWSLVILFSAWQHFELLRHGYKISRCSSERAERGRDQPPPAPGDRDAAGRRGASSRLATEAAPPGRAVARRGDRDPAGDALGAARKIHRRGAVAPVRRRQENPMADERGSRFRLPWTGPVQRVARREPVASPSSGGTRSIRACWSARRCWRAGPWRSRPGSSTCRSCSTPTCWRAPTGSSCAPSSCRPSAPKSSTASDSLSPTASTPTPSPPIRRTSKIPTRCRASSAVRSTACNGQQRQQMAERPRAQEPVRLPRPADHARGSEPRQGAESPGRGLLQGEPALLPEQRAGRTPARLCRGRQSRPRRARIHVRQPDPRPGGKILLQRDGRRKAMSTREEHLPTAGASLELTLDKYLQFIADRELRIGVEENKRSGRHGDHHAAADGRNPRACELADLQPERVRQRRPVARRNRAIQDLYEPARRSRSSPPRRRSKKA